MINPSEISQVLKQQLENVNSKVSFEETGIVLEVGDGVAHVYGLDLSLIHISSRISGQNQA